MESLAQLREIVKQVLQSQIGEYHTGTVRDTLVESSESNRLLVICTGWFKDKNYYGLIQDVAIGSDGSITIYADNTEGYLVEELIEAGVPANKILKAYDPDQQERLKQVIESMPEYRQAA